MRTLLKVIGILAVICLGTVALLTVAGFFIAHNVHVQESGSGDKKSVSIETPFGEMRVRKNSDLDPSQIGIPVYPGASRTADKGGAEFQIDSGAIHKDVTVAGATYFTGDDLDKVRDYYQQRFPGWHAKWQENQFHIENNEDGHIRSIEIRREANRTRISVASVGPPASN